MNQIKALNVDVEIDARKCEKRNNFHFLFGAGEISAARNRCRNEGKFI